MVGEYEQSGVAEQELESDIENAEQIMPDAWRLTSPPSATILDIPQSWVFYDGRGLIMIDPGGELPNESREIENTGRQFLGRLTGGGKALQLAALRQLEVRYDSVVKGVYLTHGDADHTNNIEDVTSPDVPIYVHRQERWSLLSPEKQFAAGKAIREKSPLTGHQSGKVGQRDAVFQKGIATVLNNPRSTILPGAHRAAKKRAFAQRFQDMPESFDTQAGRIDVITLPGHAPGEVGFYQADHQVFIGGDLISTSKTEQADRINLFLPEANVYQAIESLRRLRGLDIEQYYPAHGPPIIGREKIQAYLELLEQDAQTIVDRTLKLYTTLPLSAEDIEANTKVPTHQVVQKLRLHVFSDGWHRKGTAVDSEETWILSILRDRPPSA